MLRALLENPILYREWVALRRGRRPWWLAQLLFYPALVLGPSALGAATRPDFQNQRDFYALALLGHALYFSLRPLLSTLGTFATERERGTFDSLLTTRVTPRQALLERLAWALAPRFLELAVLGPLLFLVADRVGSAAWVLALTVPLILFYGALGLWASLRSATTLAAAQRALGILAFNMLGLVLLDVLFQRRGPTLSALGCPFILFLSLVAPINSESAWLTQVWWVQPLLHLLGALWLLRASLQSLRRPATIRAKVRAGRPRSWLLRVPGLAENPVIFRALLARPARAAWLVYPALLLAPLALGALAETRDGELVFMLAAFLHCLYFGVRSIYASVGAFAGERERQSWESLISTPLGAGRLLRGKLAAATTPLLLELVLWSPLWTLYLGTTHLATLEAVGRVLALTASLSLLLVALGLWLSASQQRSSRAALAGLSLLASLSLLPLLLAAAMGWGSPLLGVSPAFVVITAVTEPDSTYLPACLVYLTLAAVLLGVTARGLGRCLRPMPVN